MEGVIIFQVSLPMPPSANNAFLNVPGRGRVRSNAYRKWAEEAGWMVKARRNGCYEGPVSLLIEICPKTKRIQDIDNKIKPLADLLVACGVIPDDNNRHVKAITIRQIEDGPECTITVESIE